jgi:hypothetical protein
MLLFAMVSFLPSKALSERSTSLASLFERKAPNMMIRMYGKVEAGLAASSGHNMYSTKRYLHNKGLLTTSRGSGQMSPETTLNRRKSAADRYHQRACLLIFSLRNLPLPQTRADIATITALSLTKLPYIPSRGRQIQELYV